MEGPTWPYTRMLHLHHGKSLPWKCRWPLPGIGKPGRGGSREVKGWPGVTQLIGSCWNWVSGRVSPPGRLSSPTLLTEQVFLSGQLAAGSWRISGRPLYVTAGTSAVPIHKEAGAMVSQSRTRLEGLLGGPRLMWPMDVTESAMGAAPGVGG